jgi:hypothetical protein
MEITQVLYKKNLSEQEQARFLSSNVGCWQCCNIPGCETRNRENTEVCIAFMHQKIQRIFTLLIKTVKVIEVLLVSIEIELVIDMSAINFDMTFVDFLKSRGNNLNS